jgi:TolB-like protein/Tfp pilus assembly protein PilF
MMRAVGPAGENILPRPKKTQAVLACLCLAPGERLLRSRLAGLIWDRSGEVQARDSLRHALSELTRAGKWPIETDHDTARLDATDCWIDAFDSPDRSDLLLDSLYGVSPAFDQWLLGERNRFENRWQEALERELNELVSDAAAPELRAAAARKLLNFVPTHEAAVRTLMTAFVEMEERAQAIREYERFRLVMSNSLGMLPSEKTVASYEAIRLESRVRGTPRANRSVAPIGASNAPSGRVLQPSIAVLPFRNFSGEPGHEYLAEGLTEDLVEALSRVANLFVVSRLSAAAFKQQDRPPAEIGEALGVRYLLSGSVRAVGDQLRLIIELTDAATGAALWISRLDEKCSDLLELQNRLAGSVVRYVAPHLRSAEIKRVRRKRPEHQDAYDLLLRAQENMHTPSRTVFESAEQLFENAIACDPQFAEALAWRAHWHVMRVGQGWSPDPARDTTQADYFAERAIECDPTEPLAFAVRGHIAAYLRKDFDLALACFDTALQINPNGARAWLWNAAVHAWLGEGTPAIEKINRAMALAPYDPLICAYSGIASMAYLADRQYARAIEFSLRCMRENPSYTTAHKTLIFGLVLAGREAEARAPVHQLLRLEPGFTVRRFRQQTPVSAGPLGEIYCEALAKAGVPLSD